MRHWLHIYWPWLIPIVWLIGYEVWAVITGRQTLSELVWRGRKHFRRLPWIVLPLVGLLLLHFFFGLWQPDSQKADPCVEETR